MWRTLITSCYYNEGLGSFFYYFKVCFLTKQLGVEYIQNIEIKKKQSSIYEPYRI